jgi:hypothetical protein
MPSRLILTIVFLFILELTYSQTKCSFFNQYKNELKVYASTMIDSLKNEGIDTVLFYGVGIPNSGSMVYGKIIWTNKGIVNRCVIESPYINNARNLTNPRFSSDTNYEAIKFYFDYRLDTVTTNPTETFSMNHDYLHFVYSIINGTEVCFKAVNYLLRDKDHLRSRWIKLLSDNVDPNILCH